MITTLRVERYGSTFSIRRVMRGGFRSRSRVRELRSLARAAWKLPEWFMASWEAEWDEAAISDYRRVCWHPAQRRQSWSHAETRTIWCGACGTTLYSGGVWEVAVRDPHACTCPDVEVEGGDGFLLHSREHIGHEPSCPRVWWDGAPEMRLPSASIEEPH